MTFGSQIENKGSLKVEQAILWFMQFKTLETAKVGLQRIPVKSSEVG